MTNELRKELADSLYEMHHRLETIINCGLVGDKPSRYFTFDDQCEVTGDASEVQAYRHLEAASAHIIDAWSNLT